MDGVSRTFYICDPAKNKKCRKTGCYFLNGGECFLTTHEEYADTEHEHTIGELARKAWKIPEDEEDDMVDVLQLVWRDAELYKPKNTDKVLCVTKTKKGVLNCVMGYYDKEIGWVCGMNSNVLAWAYVDLPDWVK